MVHYKVCYFNARGRAEGVRFILVQTGVDFEDQRIAQEDWPKLKPSTPMGQLPVLYVDNKMICQSVAMARYVAKEHGLVPSNNFLAARADMVVDGLGDQYPYLYPYLMPSCGSPTKKEHLPGFLDIYEKLRAENGGKYFIGDHLTWADLMVVELLGPYAKTKNILNLPRLFSFGPRIFLEYS